MLPGTGGDGRRAGTHSDACSAVCSAGEADGERVLPILAW